MGCGGSAEASANARRKRPVKQEEPHNRLNQNDNVSPSNRFDSIVNGCKVIAAPADMLPIVCLSRDAFPVVTSFLHMEDSTPTDIQLPIIAGSVFGSGRIVSFAQLLFIYPAQLHTGDTSKVISNALNWVCGGRVSMMNIGVLGFPQGKYQITAEVLQDQGFYAEVANPKGPFDQYRALLVLSDMDTEDQTIVDNITEYVRNGGGLAVFYHHSQTGQNWISINRLLSVFGIAYTFCLLNEGLSNAGTIKVPTSYQIVRETNLVPISAQFKAVIKQTNADSSILDDLVTALRYYIMVCGDAHNDALREIASYSWEFLERTDYATKDGIGPNLSHGIIIVLLHDLYGKLPISDVKVVPEHVDFPGETGEVDMGDMEVPITVCDDVWVSTGVWLPAGIQAMVEADEDVGVNIQIGAHTSSLLGRPGPWRRWPEITNMMQVGVGEAEMGTPFGGIVYVFLDPADEPRTVSCTLRFTNICRYPRYVYDNPEVWEETKNIEVPWGEIDVGAVIFTVPSKSMKSVDFEKLKERYDIITSKISDFMSYESDTPYRIVFDVEIAASQFTSDYPLFLRDTDIDSVLIDFDTPSLELFNAVCLLATASIRTDCLDGVIETAVSILATATIFQSIFPGFDPMTLEGVADTAMFQELWEIHTNHNSDLVSETVRIFQNPDYPIADVAEDKWIAFVREMCRAGKRDFTKLLERIRPIPLNILMSLQGLPAYERGKS